jgi:PAS domain S-box-containing protein
VFFGGLWILVSDRLAAWLFPDPQLLLQINIYKGWLFIAVTAFLFYLELHREYSRVERATVELQESERRYHTLARISPVGIFRTEPNGATTYVNPKWCAISGLSADQALGNGWLEAVHPDDKEKIGAGWQKAAQLHQASFSDYRFVRPDGTLAWVMGQAVPERNAENQILGYVGTITDITERKQAENEINKLNAELEQRVEERTRELRETQEQLIRQERLAVLGRLAGGVAHELRNPLGVILNAVYYLRLVQPDVNEKIGQYHSMIEQEAHNAEKIVSDLLNFARIQSVDREPAAVSDLVQRVLERHPVPKSVTATLQLPANLPKIFADPRQVEQVLGNLIVNACQAMASTPLRGQAGSVGTPSGGELVITARQEQNMIAIAVKDTGVGIPPENMKKLFEPLFSTKLKGIGMGLAISQKLAEANGGRIEVQSELGLGSIFTLYLPMKA